MNINKKYHYFYKITNKINNHFYYGVHNTNNLEDGYMGSGKRLHIAYKKYGIENFKKEILKFFNTSKEAFEYEAEIVTEELVKDDNCYNIQQGGKTFNTEGLIPVKDKNGNCFLVKKDDPKWINKELIHNTKGTITVRHKDNNIFFRCDKDDPRYISGELVATTTGKPYVLTKDLNGNIFCVLKDDPRYISGKLIHFWNGRKHSEKSKIKLKQTLKNIGFQQGEKNSQFGTCWIYNLDNKECIKIKNEQLDDYIKLGWIKGRKMKF